MHNRELQADFDRLLEESQRRVKQKLSSAWGPNDWAIQTRGSQDRWHGRSVIRMERAPDEILARPSTPKTVFITGS